MTAHHFLVDEVDLYEVGLYEVDELALILPFKKMPLVRPCVSRTSLLVCQE